MDFRKKSIILVVLVFFCLTLISLYDFFQKKNHVTESLQGGGDLFTTEFASIDDTSSTTTGKFFLAQSHRHIVVSVNTSANASGTIKFIGSISEDSPDPTQAKSATNQYEFIQLVDLEDGATIDGDTGLVITGTDDNRLFEVNTNALKWFAPVITTYTTGTFDVDIVASKN